MRYLLAALSPRVVFQSYLIAILSWAIGWFGFGLYKTQDILGALKVVATASTVVFEAVANLVTNARF